MTESDIKELEFMKRLLAGVSFDRDILVDVVKEIKPESLRRMYVDHSRFCTERNTRSFDVTIPRYPLGERFQLELWFNNYDEEGNFVDHRGVAVFNPIEFEALFTRKRLRYEFDHTTFYDNWILFLP